MIKLFTQFGIIFAIVTISIVIIAIAILTGCECVTNLDTEKIIDPKETALALFLHAMPDQDGMTIKSNSIEVEKNLSYFQTSYKYRKVGSGIRNIKFLKSDGNSNTGNVIKFNGIFNFKKDINYTMVAYGFGSRVRSLLMKDSINGYNPKNPYVRFVHVSSDAPELKLKFKRQLTNEITLSYTKFTSLIEFPSGAYGLDIFTKSDSLVYSLNDINISEGNLYTIVIRGYFKTGGDSGKPLDCLVASVRK